MHLINKPHSSYIISHKSQNQTQVMHININHPSINFQIHKAYLNMLIHIILLRCLEIMQYHISLHSIAGEE